MRIKKIKGVTMKEEVIGYMGDNSFDRPIFMHNGRGMVSVTPQDIQNLNLLLEEAIKER